MIGYLRGVLRVKQPPWLVVDVGGVGYEIEAPMTTFYDLPGTGQEITLHTHLVVRDDAHLLYGFTRPRQRELFRHLLRVAGVGPRIALALLSGMTTEQFMQCMAEGDVASLTRVPGIGRKTAERLLVEMRDRMLDGEPVPAVGEAPSVAVTAGDPLADAVSALVALGYKPLEARRAAGSVQGEGLSSEDIIRHALRAMTGPAS